MPGATPIERFKAFLRDHPRLFVLTGAGISTGSGIPAYRDAQAAWQRPPPVQLREFIDSPAIRQRYWARSLIGWPRFCEAQPNVCHHHLAHWGTLGRVSRLVTQNVDRLHQAAGSRAVIDLHGRLDRVICLACATRFERAALQAHMRRRNPHYADLSAAIAPDGDACLEQVDTRDFQVPDCPVCGGVLKPDVVFFGENIPQARVARAIDALGDADALLVIGSSLMVYSGYRFCRLAAERGIPIAAIGPGVTRADPLLRLKLSARFEDVIDALGEPTTGRHPTQP